jgi:methionyl aminopeptidase
MSNISIKTSNEISIMAENGKLLREVLIALENEVRPGITTAFLDEMAEELIHEKGGTPSFKGYQGFPASICTSINEEVVHAFPGDRVLQEGDIISIDAGLFKNGFHSDSAITVPVGTISKEAETLMKMTKKALMKGIKAVKPGVRFGAIGNAIERFLEPYGYGIVRDLVGHGIGKELHEEPQIPNYGKKISGEIIRPGMVFAIEPMITLGTYLVTIDNINWVVKTADGSLSAHYEHTVAVTENGARILTL